MFSLPGMGSNGIRESFASTFGSTKKFLFISLTLIIYLRLAMFMIGRLTNDLSIAIFAFSMMMIMFLLVGYTPLFDAWVDGRAMNRYLSAPSILVVMWVLPSYFIARKLISQFHEAKRKFLASTASDY